MVRRSNSTPPGPRPRPALTVPNAEASARVTAQIEKARSMLSREIASWDDLKAVRREYYTWIDYGRELLRAIFSTEEISEDFGASVRMIFSVGGQPDLREDIDEFRSDLSTHLRRLESVVERLDLFEAPVDPLSRARPTAAVEADATNRVFIVHGREREPVEACARLLREQGLEPVILDEQPNRGRTVIEKFEDHADVAFAIVTMTADDIGGLAGTPTEKLAPRARQNVILELGFFVGKLGRRRVAALVSPCVEIPSDIEGVVYIAMDAGRDWRLKLAKELRDAGLKVDLNLL
jgi:predicted nucleotide-binding protein